MSVLAQNRRANFDYNLLEKYTAGVELTGHEVKSLKTRGGDLSASYITTKDGEAFLLNAQIPSFQPKNAPADYDPTRTRRLLLTKQELRTLFGKTKAGLTIIPLKVYDTHRGLIKIDIAVARGRKKGDKREYLKKREAEREIRETSS